MWSLLCLEHTFPQNCHRNYYTDPNLWPVKPISLLVVISEGFRGGQQASWLKQSKLG